MFRLAVSLIGFITTAAMHPAMADPAAAAPSASAYYAPASEQPVQAQGPVLGINAPLALGGVDEMMTFVIPGSVLLLALLSGILLDDPVQNPANKTASPLTRTLTSTRRGILCL